MNEIHDQLFKSMQNTQIASINESIIKDAKKVILGLLPHITDQNRHNSSESDNAILNALEWLKNNQS